MAFSASAIHAGGGGFFGFQPLGTATPVAASTYFPGSVGCLNWTRKRPFRAFGAYPTCLPSASVMA
jgi:hypothetical protein